MNQCFIVPDLVIYKVQSHDTMEVASLFASTITRSGELVGEEEQKGRKGGKLKHYGVKQRD